MLDVAAIIPTRNQLPHLLERAAKSAVRTNCREVVVVIDRVQAKWETPAGVRILKSEGEGISAALNTGIKYTTSAKIAFLDSDDEWMTDKQNQFKHAAPATFTDYYCDGVQVLCNQDLSRQTTDNIMCRSTTVLDRNVVAAVGGFDPGLTWCQDWDFNCRVHVHCGWTRLLTPTAFVADLLTGHTRMSDPVTRNRCRASVATRWRGK